MIKKFIEKIKIVIKEFLYIDEKIEIGEYYVGKDNRKRYNLKYKCCCGKFIIHGSHKQSYNTITMYQNDPIFSFVYKQCHLTDIDFIKYIKENMETIFKIKYNPHSKNTIINHKYCKKCIIYKNKLMIDIQQELLDKKIYRLDIDGVKTNRYGYCNGFDKGTMKTGMKYYIKCCNVNGVKISINNITWNILPINDFIIKKSARKNNKFYYSICDNIDKNMCYCCKKKNNFIKDSNKDEVDIELSKDEVNIELNKDELDLYEKDISPTHQGRLLLFDVEFKNKNYRLYSTKYNRIYAITEGKAHLGGKCIDCGEEDYRLLEFDHKSNKIFSIAGTSGHSREKIKKEINKCDLRCVNCHHVKSINTLYKESNHNHNNKHLQTFWYKEEYSIYEIIKYFGLCENRVFKTYLINKKKKEGCSKCGCKKYVNNYPGVYQLNHLVDSKVLDVCSMKKLPDYNVLDIYCELLKCEVLCGNCHKLFTLNKRYSGSIMYEIKNKDDFKNLKSPECYNTKTFKEASLTKSGNKIRVLFRQADALKLYGEYPLREFKENEKEEAIKFRNEVQNNITNINNINIEEFQKKYHEDKKLSNCYYKNWLKNYNNYIAFIEKNKKKPNKGSSVKEEKSLGYWFQNQKALYKKNGGMFVHSEICDKFKIIYSN